MKKLYLFTIVTILSVQNALAGYLDGFSAEKVSNHVYVIHGPTELPNETNEGFMNNPAFVVADTGVVVVDPGSSVHTGNMLLREIRKITDMPVIAVFDTHVHGDHSYQTSHDQQHGQVFYRHATYKQEQHAG